MTDLRHRIVAVYGELATRQMLSGASGNVSARDGDGMIITPSGATPATIQAYGLVAMRLNGDAGGLSRPSSEWEMHATIYRSAPEAGAIVHTHADACTALACLGEDLPGFHYAVAEFGGDEVRCAPYATFGTSELALAAAAAIAGRTACLLANHGMICHGPSPEAALATAIRLETLCRQYLMARATGIPRLLDTDQMRAARLRYRSYGLDGPLR